MEINQIRDNYEIRNIATSNFLSEFTDSELVDALILVDIEGSEYELFKDVDMSRLRQSLVIIELHEFVDESDLKVENLLLKLSTTHLISVIHTGPRNLDSFMELEGIPDSDRWLIISGGRPKNMKWVLCEQIIGNV